MTDETEPTDDDVRDAVKLLHALTGAEPYAEAIERIAELEAVVERVRELCLECDRSLSPRDVVDAIEDTLDAT